MVAATDDVLQYKERGNGLFKKAEYQLAITEYSKGLDLLDGRTCTEGALILKNRAACYLKLERYDDVVTDINMCISDGGGDSKAYYRRAVAHQNLKQADRALKDAMDAVRIDPKNKAAIDLVMAIRRDIQGRKDLMTSTTGLVDEMLTSLRDQEADVDKKTLAMKNLVNLTAQKAGSEIVFRKSGLKDVLKYIHQDKIQVHAMNCIMCLARDSLQRSTAILKSVPLESSIRILKQNNDCSPLVGGVLYEMLNSVLEDRGFDYTKRELGESIKRFSVPKLLPTLFDYFKECTKVAEDEAMNSLLNAMVKVTDSRVINEQLLNLEMVHFLVSLILQGRIRYDHSQQISVAISRIWTRARSDDKQSLKFVKQANSLINPRLLSGDEKNMMNALKALNILLQGSFEAGGDIIKDATELYRIVSKLLTSSNIEAQKTAAESVALMASDKKMCYNLAGQNFNLLKALYKSTEVDDSVKLRALVGMSKMCASSGGDVTRQVIADGAGVRIFKQIRQLLLKNPTEEARTWVIEALAYLTIDAEVKHALAADTEQMGIICDYSSNPSPNSCYSLACIFMNLTNTYDKPEIEPEMARIAEYAKQNIPKEHELDSEDNLKQRIQHMIDSKVPGVLATCAGADSERTREFIARSYLGILSVEDGAHCGAVVQMGGTRSLLNLFNDNTDVGKKNAAHAIAKIAIKMNPALAFSGQRALDACRPCISLIEATNPNTFLVYDGLMALTNLASVSDSVRERILREGGCHHVEFQSLEDNDALRRAAVQCICNMVISEKVKERYLPEDKESTEPVDRLKAIMVFCGDEEYYTRMAALGAIAYLSTDPRVCLCLRNIGSFEAIVKETVCIEDPGIRHRILVVLQNMLASDKEVAEYIIGTPIFECLLALQQLDGTTKGPMTDILANCMDAAKHWGLIQENPGDYAYSATQQST